MLLPVDGERHPEQRQEQPLLLELFEEFLRDVHAALLAPVDEPVHGQGRAQPEGVELQEEPEQRIASERDPRELVVRHEVSVAASVSSAFGPPDSTVVDFNSTRV